MRVMKKALLVSIACAAAMPALAYDKGDLIVRAGAVQATPEATNNTSVNGLDVDDNAQLGLTLTYMLTPKVAIGVLGATPFEHDITLNGNTVGSVQHLPPTVSLEYFPLEAGSSVQPYVGIGLNYTKFWGEEASGALAGSVLSLEDSLGLAVEAGVDVKVADNIVLNAAIWKVDINTNVYLNGGSLGEIEIDPLVAMVGVGMKF